MALKDIRVTFYYSDEGVFDKTKQWQTRKRIVTWANEFYKRYGFKINEFPIPYNESLYKKTFCLKKTNGFKADYTRRVYYEVFKEELDKDGAVLTSDWEKLKANLPSDPTEAKAQLEALAARMQQQNDKMLQLLEFLQEIRPDEIEFRREIKQKISATKFSTKKPRLVVVFCEFMNWFFLFRENRTLAETFKNEQNVPTFMMWNLVSILFPDTEVFTAPIILIDVNRITRAFDYVLAHEVVHAAGNTTLDNQGTAGNIMIYADSQGKGPRDVNLEATDKAKLEAAFFVV